MALDTDLLFDRRRLKRQLGFWRVVGVAAIVLAVLAAVGRMTGGFERAHIARLAVDGIILQDRDRDRALREAAGDKSVAALIVVIDSPGGTVVGGEDLYRTLREVAAKKPVVAVMGTMATSAAYMTAIAADRIFAREGTVTGSIGVIFQSTEFTGLMDKLGIAAEAIKSAPLKAQPSPLEKLSEEGRAATRALVMDMFDMFVAMVAERRSFDRAAAERLADGRVYTGRQAERAGLIDEIGDEEKARTWLTAVRGVRAGLPVRPLKIAPEDRSWPGLASMLFGKTFLSEALILDGLVSVWHPDLVVAVPR